MSLTKKYRILLGAILAITSTPMFPFFFSSPVKPKRVVTIMLDPAGDAQQTGRTIDDALERTLTLQYAEKLKQVVEEQNTNVRVVLSRDPGQTVQPLQNAHFANRLNVDLYLSIHFYAEHATQPTIYLYNFSYNDDFITKKFDTAFCSYDQAHLFNYGLTRTHGTIIQQTLHAEEYKRQFTCAGMYKLPCKPLIGIKAPAIMFEAGLKDKDTWTTYVDPIAESLKKIITMVQA
ncbi:MAG: N-acetylmuramoyl-L-alanine amidase [Candidatus Dependentiae bacterium]|nr:N-acetylmuramoyl-L-alanine amidase [Candidatus Dependentiae bacterium]